MPPSPSLSSSAWFRLSAALLGLALWLGLLLPSLERSRLQDVDELWHALPTQGAVLDGHWWPLQLESRAFYEKPPLMPWLVAVTVTLSGDARASWPYRLWNTLFGALILASLLALGALAGNFWGGFFAAALLGLQGDFVFHCRFYSMDTPFLGFTLLGAVLMAWALERGPQSRAWNLAGWALALAFWCKSWFALALLPALGLSLWTALRGWKERGAIFWRLAWPLGLAILAWLALYSSWAGRDFLRQEWQENLWGRVKGGPDWSLAKHVRGYLDWAKLSAPAMLALALGVSLGLGPKRPPQARAAFVRLLAWTLAVTWILGLLLIRFQSINYLLPLEAALALGLGLALFEGQERAVQLVLAVLLLLAGLTMRQGLDPWTYLWAGGILGLLMAWGRWRGRRLSEPTVSLRLVALAFLLLQVPDAVRLCLRPLDAHRQLAAVLEANPAREKGEILWAVRIPSRAVDFYSSYKVEHVNDLGEARGGHAILFRSNDGKLHFVPARTVLPPKAP